MDKEIAIKCVCCAELPINDDAMDLPNGTPKAERLRILAAWFAEWDEVMA